MNKKEDLSSESCNKSNTNRRRELSEKTLIKNLMPKKKGSTMLRKYVPGQIFYNPTHKPPPLNLDLKPYLKKYNSQQHSDTEDNLNSESDGDIFSVTPTTIKMQRKQLKYIKLGIVPKFKSCETNADKIKLNFKDQYLIIVFKNFIDEFPEGYLDSNTNRYSYVNEDNQHNESQEENEEDEKVKNPERKNILETMQEIVEKYSSQ